jgi:hypothetical protein
MKIQIRMVSEGGKVLETHELNVPKGAFSFRCYFDNEPLNMNAHCYPLPVSRNVKHEGWVSPVYLFDKPVDDTWKKVSWEDESYD